MWLEQSEVSEQEVVRGLTRYHGWGWKGRSFRALEAALSFLDFILSELRSCGRILSRKVKDICIFSGRFPSFLETSPLRSFSSEYRRLGKIKRKTEQTPFKLLLLPHPVNAYSG